VTVDRNNVNGIRFYVDGTPLGTPFNPIPRSLTLDSSANLVLGRNYAVGGAGSYLIGQLDEVEIFRRVITGADVSAVYRAGIAGKCRETCYASTRAVCCNGSANASVTICNYDVVSHVYSYGLNPVSGPGCAGVGVTSFAPNSGTVTVGPGECLVVPVTMACPTDHPFGQESCYEATIYNHDTGALFGCQGSVRRPGWWCITWDTVAKPIKGMISVPPQATMTVSVAIKHLAVAGPAPVPVDFAYELHPVEADGFTRSSSLSLDGLPPGEPLIGSVAIPTEGVAEPFTVHYDALQPLSFQRVVLMGDDDMDGFLEPLAEFALRSDESATTGIDSIDGGGTPEAPQRPFLALPNPFNSSGRISFRIGGKGLQRVSLQLFDLRGREIKRFYRKVGLEPGIHEIDWNGTNGYGVPLPSGVYFLRLETDGFRETVKVVLKR
jgi:hypothetical protein